MLRCRAARPLRSMRHIRRVGSVTSLALIALFASLCLPNPASASGFSWCAVPRLVPRVPADFETVLSELRRLGGCRVQVEADDVDDAVAFCAAQEAGAAHGPVWIYLTRAEGFGISILFSTMGLASLDVVRRCPASPFTDAERFSAGSIFVRDRLAADGGDTKLTLINSGSGTVSHLYSSSGFNSGAIEHAYDSAFLGVPPPASLNTSVRLEGVDPLSTPAPKLLATLLGRGAQVIEQRGAGGDEPMTCVSGGTTVGGAGSVCIQDALGHILSVTYRIPDRGHFKAEVAKISARLDPPLEEKSNGCSLKWWTSGEMLARASYCDREGGNITFINTIVTVQREMLRERYPLEVDAP